MNTFIVTDSDDLIEFCELIDLSREYMIDDAALSWEMFEPLAGIG